ncbi:DUF4279 domain-containing protein [Roseateles sp.]|uniref:DUF4279 domain-containing protein n=1 Tax=Roseateles sp. TaxID=1971397 RepID=UPI003BAD2622
MNTFSYEISFRAFGVSLSPDELTDKLGLAPKWKRKAGERRVSAGGALLEGVYDSGYCSFPFPHKDDEDIEAFLDQTLLNLEAHEEFFLNLKKSGVRLELFVGWYSAGNTGAIFESEVLSKLGKLGIDLAMDVYGESEKLGSGTA